jgi:flavin reductase (DIM6/NTAB) family NADH-FMN oxidoreductase RutF
MNFEEIFQKRDIEQLKPQLVLGNFYLITAGDETKYNIMTGSHPGFNIFLHKNCFSVFVADTRYTLELVRQYGKFSVAFFDKADLDVVKTMGFRSGRDTDKVKELPYVRVTTPNGNISYANARLVVDLQLLSTTTIKPEDLVDQEDASKLADKKGPYAYNTLVVGEIVDIFERV